jgi:hypothetical protein
MKCTHRLESRMSYLGIQDATRKRRRITQRPGEWNGSIIIAVEGVGLFVTVSEKKWLKTILEKLDQSWSNDKTSTRVKYKQLERDIGCLVHLSMSYPEMTPYLRGFYLTMNSWRKGRDKDGWKLSPRAYRKRLPCSSLILVGNHGSSNIPNCWWTWKGTCVKCSRRVVAPGGIFCQNIFCSVGGLEELSFCQLCKLLSGR